MEITAPCAASSSARGERGRSGSLPDIKKEGLQPRAETIGRRKRNVEPLSPQSRTAFCFTALIGRTTKDIELKQTKSGKAVISFALAVNKDFRNEDGTRDADFIDCVAFDKRAEAIAKYVGKGDKLAINGKISTRTYSRNDGSNAKVVEIIVEGFEFLESKKTDASQTAHFEPLESDGDLPF